MLVYVCVCVWVYVFCSKLIKISKYNKAAGGACGRGTAGLPHNMLPTFWHFQHVSDASLRSRSRSSFHFFLSCLCELAFLLLFLRMLLLFSVDVCVDFWQLPSHTDMAKHTRRHENNNKNLLPKLRQIASAPFRPPTPLSPSVIVRLCALDVHTFWPYL